jgi:adenine deaminase
MHLRGNIVDITNKKIEVGDLIVGSNKIVSITKISTTVDETLPYIIPGFIDSHIHIESSMLTPSQFALMAVVHGTVATISDPHEIANVCGMQGVEFMIADGKTVPFKFNFGAPSCVPATVFETAGAAITVTDVAALLQRDDIKYLSEMMNFPGVLHNDAEVMDKIDLAIKYQKPIDGHAPGLRGEMALQYIKANKGAITISTDHECFTKEEAVDKLKHGMKILIREGSAAKNFDPLIELLHDWEDMMMFCSDDKHPDSLEVGHINDLCARAVAKGVDVFKVLKAACVNPVLHYKLDVGLLKEHDWADFIVVNNLKEFKVQQTYINGELVSENGISLIKTIESGIINNFNCGLKKVTDFAVPENTYNSFVPVIVALDGQLITEKISIEKGLLLKRDQLVGNIYEDVLKIVVVNRYSEAPIAKAFIHNFGLKKGAIASSVAHDSHNIVAVGVDDESICKAVNAVVNCQGGLSYAVDIDSEVLALPIAGLMTNENGYTVSKAYTKIDNYVKQELGSTLQSPYMTLSFMALLVIPHLKLSDKGLFDGDRFEFVNDVTL